MANAHPWHFEKGLHALGNQVYAYLQPDGSWGWSNAGLIVDGEHSLLVDTLWDVRLTRDMLAEMARATPAAAHIERVVNTHANGDHCWGNQLVAGAEIIASRRGAQEMAEFTPEKMVGLLKLARAANGMGGFGRGLGKLFGGIGLSKVEDLIGAAPFVLEIFGAFHFDEVILTPPTRTFDEHLTLMVGNKKVELLEVGPAHTQGDVLVYVPDDRLMFTGDILFIRGTPVVWAGPVSNWIRACDRILELPVEVIVPGHGPITDKTGVQEVKGYLEFVLEQATQRHQQGMNAMDAALDIPLGAYRDWLDAERLAVNVETVYRELRGDPAPADPIQMFGRMARLRTHLRSAPAARA